jgi:hypothetical protein
MSDVWWEFTVTFRGPIRASGDGQILGDLFDRVNEAMEAWKIDDWIGSARMVSDAEMNDEEQT